MNESIKQLLIPVLDVIVSGNKCTFCNHQIVMSEFKDSLSVKEYQLSGFCQECQDNTFNELPQILSQGKEENEPKKKTKDLYSLKY